VNPPHPHPHPLELALPLRLRDLETVQQEESARPRSHRGDTAFDDASAARVSAGVAKGDSAALEALYRAWFARAFGLARGWTRRDEAFCLDVVQEAMLRAIRSLAAVPTGAALDGWMTTAVRSASVDALRREGRRLARERVHAQRRATNEDKPERDDLDDVLAALDELDPAEARLLRLRFERDLSLRAAAKYTGSTLGSVHGRIRRAVARLRKFLEEDGDE
jgi:RNA polymerase sigma factor (sigma-70 family)